MKACSEGGCVHKTVHDVEVGSEMDAGLADAAPAKHTPGCDVVRRVIFEDIVLP